MRDIGVNAFRGCGSLKSVSLRESVTRIGKEAFGGCVSLTELTLPKGCKAERNAFPKGCKVKGRLRAFFSTLGK